MGITEAAHRNHEELFPNHKSQLKLCDPELIEVFDDFAFDDPLIDVITQVPPWVGYPRTLNALNAVNEVVPDNSRRCLLTAKRNV